MVVMVVMVIVVVVMVIIAVHGNYFAGFGVYAHFVFAFAVFNVDFVVRAVVAAAFKIHIVHFAAAHAGFGDGDGFGAADVAAAVFRLRGQSGKAKRQDDAG